MKGIVISDRDGGSQLPLPYYLPNLQATATWQGNDRSRNERANINTFDKYPL